jgi:hypothetical protein
VTGLGEGVYWGPYSTRITVLYLIGNQRISTQKSLSMPIRVSAISHLSHPTRGPPHPPFQRARYISRALTLYHADLPALKTQSLSTQANATGIHPKIPHSPARTCESFLSRTMHLAYSSTGASIDRSNDHARRRLLPPEHTFRSDWWIDRTLSIIIPTRQVQ